LDVQAKPLIERHTCNLLNFTQNGFTESILPADTRVSHPTFAAGVAAQIVPLGSSGTEEGNDQTDTCPTKMLSNTREASLCDLASSFVLSAPVSAWSDESTKCACTPSETNLSDVLSSIKLDIPSSIENTISVARNNNSKFWWALYGHARPTT
jgi:hypothetical protein